MTYIQNRWGELPKLYQNSVAVDYMQTSPPKRTIPSIWKKKKEGTIHTKFSGSPLCIFMFPYVNFFEMPSAIVACHQIVYISEFPYKVILDFDVLSPVCAPLRSFKKKTTVLCNMWVGHAIVFFKLSSLGAIEPHILMGNNGINNKYRDASLMILLQVDWIHMGRIPMYFPDDPTTSFSSISPNYLLFSLWSST